MASDSWLKRAHTLTGYKDDGSHFNDYTCCSAAASDSWLKRTHTHTGYKDDGSHINDYTCSYTSDKDLHDVLRTAVYVPGWCGTAKYVPFRCAARMQCV